MSFWDRIKEIFGGDSDLSDIFSNNTINFTLFDFSTNESKVIEVREADDADHPHALSIDPSKVTPEQNEELRELIREELIQQEEKPFLTDDSLRKTNQIKENLPDEEDAEILDFYKGKLDPDMYKALELALVIRKSFRKGEDIQGLKKDVIRRYPEFGKNLCNLVTEGYFHGHFRDLYQSMKKEESFDLHDYRTKVKHIVKSLPYTIFCSQDKRYEDVKAEFEQKYRRLSRYGTGKMLTHALGTSNVTTCLQLLTYIEEGYSQVDIQRQVNPSGTYITAKLTF